MRSNRRTPVACGVDIGSTNVKVVALARDGAVLARASRPTPRDAQGLCTPAPVLMQAVEALFLQVCGDAYEAHALCTVGVGEDGLLLDADLRPLLPAMAWFDPRRQGILRSLRPLPEDDETFDVASDASRTLVGWRWAREQPRCESARTWVAVADLPAVLWTGRTFLSDTLASRTGAWRASTRKWAAVRVAVSLGSADLLPAVLPVGAVVGRVHAPSLQGAGAVSRDAIAVAGGHDHPVGGWGVAQLVPGAVLDSMGTAEVVVVQSPSPPSRFVGEVDRAPGIRSTGTTLLRVVELSRNVAWAAQDPEVASWISALLRGAADPGPALHAEHFRPGRRGGDRPSYAPDVPPDARARASAVLGALARAGREAVTRVCEGAADRSAVRLAGGWARSPGWVAIKETVNGYPTELITEPEVTAVGAALLAATARGWQPDPATALAGPTE